MGNEGPLFLGSYPPDGLSDGELGPVSPHAARNRRLPHLFQVDYPHSWLLELRALRRIVRMVAGGTFACSTICRHSTNDRRAFGVTASPFIVPCSRSTLPACQPSRHAGSAAGLDKCFPQIDNTSLPCHTDFPGFHARRTRRDAFTAQTPATFDVSLVLGFQAEVSHPRLTAQLAKPLWQWWLQNVHSGGHRHGRSESVPLVCNCARMVRSSATATGHAPSVMPNADEFPHL